MSTEDVLYRELCRVGEMAFGSYETSRRCQMWFSDNAEVSIPHHGLHVVEVVWISNQSLPFIACILQIKIFKNLETGLLYYVLFVTMFIVLCFIYLKLQHLSINLNKQTCRLCSDYTLQLCKKSLCM